MTNVVDVDARRPQATIAQPRREFGEHAMRLLLRRIAGELPPSTTLAHTLVVRRSALKCHEADVCGCSGRKTRLPPVAEDPGGDPRFTTLNVPIGAIAVCSGQNEHGAFEVTFNGERHLPFEGAGVISRWRLELPHDFRPFDYDTIADVGIRLQYTARDGGALLVEFNRLFSHSHSIVAGGLLETS
jgi:hypothetical protein